MELSLNNPSDKIDYTDIAYFSFGVQRFVQENDINMDRWGGHIGFVDACMPASTGMMDFHYDGVWAYDVAEPFGYRVAQRLAESASLGPAHTEFLKFILENFEIR